MRKKIAYFFVLIIFILVIPIKIHPSLGSNNFAYSWEIKKLQDEFEKNVGLTILEENYSKLILTDAIQKILNIPENTQSQYFVYTDRNPGKQIILVCFFDSAARNITIIGVDKISTGDPKRIGHFITPTGVFENSIKHPSYRALGTKNQKGWRGLGGKNSRIWDFGWRETIKDKQKVEVRLLMHATDPFFGEKRLGQIDSKGCVRVSAKLNKFLDHYGLLDKNYEENKQRKKISWFLAADREPTVWAGKYLLVGDSEIPDIYPKAPDSLTNQ